MPSITLRLLALLAVACAAQPTTAALIGITTNNPTIPGTPDGYLVNDLLIDFDGRLFGQQMIIELEQGHFYQDPFGGETAPNSALFNVFPALEADTFLTMGGPTVNSSESTLVVGGSTEFPQSIGVKQFDEDRIDIAWAPAPGVVIEDQLSFMVARITLSDDAKGRVYYFHNSGGETTLITQDGCLSGGNIYMLCPEPTSAMLVALGSVAIVNLRLRRS